MPVWLCQGLLKSRGQEHCTTKHIISAGEHEDGQNKIFEHWINPPRVQSMMVVRAQKLLESF